jgi:hypothetical protein
LTGGSFDEGNMIKNTEACEWLTSAIKNLEASNLDPCYATLRAVGSLFLVSSLFFLDALRRFSLNIYSLRSKI